MVTIEQLRAIIPGNKEPEAWLPLINELLPKHGIDTPRRVAAFLSQSAHESTDFTKLEENLRYSAKRLVQVWPTRFTASNAPAYAYNPEKLANKVYSDRMGNGSEASGEGWLYRGRGIKQLTGKYNYTKFSEWAGIELKDAPEYAETKRGAVESAVWFWTSNKLNRFADVEDVTGLTQAINGGTTGLTDRKSRYSKAIKAFQGLDPKANMFESSPSQPEPVEPTPVAAKKYPTLYKGVKGQTELVKKLQAKLDFQSGWIDGVYGTATVIRVKAYQQKFGLAADGIAGNQTLTHMFGPAS